MTRPMPVSSCRCNSGQQRHWLGPDHRYQRRGLYSFRGHLARHRGASQHTCDSHAYSFQPLFAFASQKLKVGPSALSVEQLAFSTGSK